MSALGKGTPLDRESAGTALRGVCDRVGRPRIRPHDLRHSCASLLLALGYHPKVVAEWLGHSTVNLTLNTYSHVLPIPQKDAADGLDKLLRAR